MKPILSYLLVAFVVLVTGCATLPPPKDRVETTALTDTAGTRLGRAIAPGVAANPGKTGIHALPDPRDAFAARVLLAGAAEKSLDAQYFIWNGDHVGYLLFQALWQAAERGVRVRLLLDDLNTKGLDSTIAALDAHPNIEVRLYNPVVIRDNRVLNFVTDFTRVNRRMHNKSFTADNQATVVGGRNIADEYFGAGAGLAFADLDVLAVGPAVPEVSKEFDVYWNSASAYPASGFVGRAGAGRHRQSRGQIRGEPRRPRIDRLYRGGPRDAAGARAARPEARARVGGRRGRVRRPGQDARHHGADRRAAVPGARAQDGPAGEDARHRLAVLRARRRRHRAAGGAGEARRDRAHPHQLARGVRREVGAFGLREAPPRPAPGRCPALRDQADRDEGKATNPAAGSDQVRPPACMPRRSPSTAAGSSSARSTSTSARRGSTPKWVWCSAIRCSRRV